MTGPKTLAALSGCVAIAPQDESTAPIASSMPTPADITELPASAQENYD